MLDNRRVDLCNYRMAAAEETLQVAKECFEGKHYKDAINRSYYAAFYAVKSVLAMEEKDFKRHKDVMAYFNQKYVASGIFPKDLGRKLARLQQKREKSDYDDFYIASREEAEEQISYTQEVVAKVKEYLKTESEEPKEVQDDV